MKLDMIKMHCCKIVGTNSLEHNFLDPLAVIVLHLGASNFA